MGDSSNFFWPSQKSWTLRNKWYEGTIFYDQLSIYFIRMRNNLALRNNFRVTKKFLITKFDYTSNNSRFFLYCHKSYEFKSEEIFDHCWKILFYNFFQFAMNIKVARLSTVNCSANIISLPLMFVSDASTSETSISFILVLIQNSI